MLEKSKYDLVGSVFRAKQDLDGDLSVLDVGCRDCVLKGYLPADTAYAGVDLFQNDDGTVDHVQDLTDGLPFPDKTWGVVTALDVVEHVDDMHGALSELWRVTGRHLVVVLPNMAFITFRLKLMFTGHIGTDKYDLKFPGGGDRHRWLTTQAQSDSYMQAFARSVGAEFEIIHTAESPNRARLAKLCKLVGIGPNVWSWASLYVLTRPAQA